MSSKTEPELTLNITPQAYSPEYRQVMDAAFSLAKGSKEHIVRVADLLEALRQNYPGAIENVLGKTSLTYPVHSAEEVESTEQIVFSSETDRTLSMQGGSMEEVMTSLRHPATIDVIHLAAALFLHPGGPILEFLNVNGLSPSDTGYAPRILDAVRRYDNELQQRERRERFLSVMKILREIRAKGLGECFGQDAAVQSVTSEIGSFWGQTTSDRDNKPLSFVFVGGTGTGKTVLAKAIRDSVSEKKGCPVVATLDMTRFSAENLVQDIIGRDSSWRDGGQEGALTSLAAASPCGVLLIENLDKTHPDAIAHVNTILSEGELKDEFTDVMVPFSKNIVIITMNQGSEFIASEKFARLSNSNGGNIPREKLIEGLADTIESTTPQSAGPIAEILRKVDHVIPFHGHTVPSLLKIIGKAVDNTTDILAREYDADISFDRTRVCQFFLETLQKLDSAHGVEQAVSTAFRTKLQSVFMDCESADPHECKHIKIVVDPFPELEDGIPAPPDDVERTAMRLKQAKRLDYSVSVSLSADTATIKLTDFSYTVMPAIEDAGWFSVVAANTRISELVGLERPWASVKRTIDHFRNPSPTALKPETGILLYGPPGTGKTSFAKAVATELGKSFICVSGSDFCATECDNRAIQRVHALFAVARRNDAVLFIDEIDAIGNRGTVSSAQAAVINAFLTELDGFEERSVLVIGATNRIDMLDGALTRAGRLHTLIKVDVLNKAEDRERLVKLVCAKARRDLAPDLREFIVRTTYGWSPASIQSVLRETLHRAGSDEATRTHFIAARNVEFSGEETQRQDLTESERRSVAIHEAGHALVASLHGHKWVQVTVNGVLGNLGFLEHLQEGALGWSEKRLREAIDVVLGGRVAESLLSTPTEGAASDLRKATDYAIRIVCGGFGETDDLAVTPESASGSREWERIHPKVSDLLTERRTEVSKMLSANLDALNAIVNELSDKGVLFSDEVEKIISQNAATGKPRTQEAANAR